MGIKNDERVSLLRSPIDGEVIGFGVYGEQRRHNLQNLAGILRRADLRGHDLKTNYNFHYGLLHWLLGAVTGAGSFEKRSSPPRSAAFVSTTRSLPP